MNLKELINKIDNLNKLNKELDLGDKYYLVITEMFSSPVYVYNKKEMKNIDDYYISTVASSLKNNKLEKVDRYNYQIEIQECLYNITIGNHREVW